MIKWERKKSKKGKINRVKRVSKNGERGGGGVKKGRGEGEEGRGERETKRDKRGVVKRNWRAPFPLSTTERQELQASSSTTLLCRF
jgi:hypothetical protein